MKSVFSALINTTYFNYLIFQQFQ